MARGSAVAEAIAHAEDAERNRVSSISGRAGVRTLPEPCRAPAEESRSPQARPTWVRRMVVRACRVAVQGKSQHPARRPHSGCETDACALRTTASRAPECAASRGMDPTVCRAPRTLFSLQTGSVRISRGPSRFPAGAARARPIQACAKGRTARGILPRACSGARGGAQSHALTDRKLGDCAAIASADPVRPKRLARTA